MVQQSTQSMVPASELTHLESAFCHALTSLCANVNSVLQRLVERDVLSHADMQAFSAGMDAHLSELTQVETHPWSAHAYPEDENYLRSCMNFDEDTCY